MYYSLSTISIVIPETTENHFKKAKVLLPDVFFRQATAPLSYFIFFLQIGISHQ